MTYYPDIRKRTNILIFRYLTEYSVLFVTIGVKNDGI